LQLQEPLASSQLGATITLSLVFEFYPLRKLSSCSGLQLRAIWVRLPLE
jgi:hypothetical protein